MGLESKAPATPRGDHSGAKLKWPDEPHPSDKEGDTDNEETGDDESQRTRVSRPRSSSFGLS